MSSGSRHLMPSRLARVAFAAALAAVLLAVSRPLAAQDMKPRTAPDAQAGPVQQPADPSAVKGTWTIGDKTDKVTAGEYHAAQVLLGKIEGTAQQAVMKERVWEYILLGREAEALGIAVTDAEVDAAMQKDDPDLYGGLINRWKQQGVEESAGRAYMRHERLVEKMKDLFVNNIRITTQEAFDVYKRQHYRFKLSYARFAAQDYEADLPRSSIDDVTLKTFWAENKVVQSQFRTPNTVSAEYVYLDPAMINPDQVPATAPKREISKTEALEYFQKHKDQLMQQVPADKQHLLVINADTPLEKVVSPFSVLEETIKKSLVFHDILNAALAEAKAGGTAADLQAIASKYGLGYTKVETVDRPQSVQQLQRFGFNAFVNLNAANVGDVSPVADERGTKYFFRLNAKAVSILPEFAEIKDKILDKYIETQTLDKARKAAQELMTFINDKINEHVQPLQDRLAKEADEEAERRIKAEGIAKEEDKNRQRSIARSTIRQKLEDEKKTLRPRFFDQYVAEKQLKLHETDYFEFEPMRADRAAMTDLEASRLAFLKTNFFIQSLNAGDVTPAVLEDGQTKTFMVAKLIDKAEPDINTMGAVDLYQARSLLKQTKEAEFLQRWRYLMIVKRLNLQLTGI
jgi:hypothetical protein